MHIRKGLWRHFISAAALVTFALPLATPLSTPASAQAGQGFSTDVYGAGYVNPTVAINPLGQAETFTFTCTAGDDFPAGDTVAGTQTSADCYSISIFAQDISTSSAQAPLNSATCAGTQAGILTPPGGTSGGGAFCQDLAGLTPGGSAGPVNSNGFYGTPVQGQQATATIQEYLPHVYAITFAGWVPAACPAGYQFNSASITQNPPSADYQQGCVSNSGVGTTAAICPPGPNGGPSELTGPPVAGQTIQGFFTGALDGYFCQFSVTAQKKYVEITSVKLTQIGNCGGTLTFAEGLKAYFGPSCLYVATASGITIIKSPEDCTQATNFNSSALAGEGFNSGAAYACVGGANGTLEVTGVTIPGINIEFCVGTCSSPSGTGLFPATVTSSSVSPASGNTVTANGGATNTSVGQQLCSGTGGASTLMAPTYSGTVTLGTTPYTNPAFAYFCPSGVGAGTVQACVVSPGGSATSTGLNTQPAACSNLLNFAFTVNAERTVPYVRWAGEKIALTKCFGAGLARDDVEFTLKGDNPGLNATLLPATIGAGTATGTGPGTGFGTSPTDTPTADTIWTVTDKNGCATVIGYADGEGVMYVDAAIYGSNSVLNTSATTALTAPLINEHAFEVFYLKFDRVDLENITFTTYPTATAFAPYYTSFLAASPSFFDFDAAGAPANASTFPTSFPNVGLGLPTPPGAGEVAAPTGYSVPLCKDQYVRAMVHGYFEIPGDPSGRPASTVAIPGAPAGSAGSYVLPAGRWILPEDWPLLATFAGVSPAGTGTDVGPSSYYAWDLNSGYVFNPAGERPVVCEGTNTANFGVPAANPEVPGNGPLNIVGSGGTGNEQVDLGPCFGQDAANTPYVTAYNNLAYTLTGSAVAPSACTGETVGIGPFDATQSCTFPFPLTYSPAGSADIGTTSVGCLGGAAPCIVPAGPNSTYLPNGTLNEWDAPMPPAMISFSLLNGPGFLSEVNKTGLYAVTFDTGAAGPCPAGYSLNSTSGTCQIVFNPNPFYAEAIPASPLIPPVTNNGGYLWDSWNFQYGGTSFVTCAAATINGFTNNAACGAFVPGESTTNNLAANVCPYNFSYSAANVDCELAYGGAYTSLQCGLAGYSTANAGYCSAPPIVTSATTVRGGTNLSDYGSCANIGSMNGDQVVVSNGAGFYAGETVEAFLQSDGDQVAYYGDLTVVTVTPVNVPGDPGAALLTFTLGNGFSAAGTCYPAGTLEFYGGDFAITVNNPGSFSPGQFITVISEAGEYTGQVTAVVGDMVYIFSSDTLATDLNPGCFGISRPTSYPATLPGGFLPTTPNACEPATLLPEGTTITYNAPTSAGPVITTAPPKPYPFWQWLSNPGATPTSGGPTYGATVYSDNHGEAVVDLSTTVTPEIAPVNGACPSTTIPVTAGNTITTCLLTYASLAALGFQTFSNKALTGLSASSPGCVATFSTGTVAAVPGATVGATGPAAGQICVNSQGGIELGASAVLGTTSIQAIADYPYTRGEHPAVGSAVLTKVFTSAFAKTLTVSAGTPGPAGTTSYTVTITATDICGNPIVGEPVEVYALSGASGAVVLAPVSGGAVLSSSNSSAVVTPDNTGTATLSLEVLNSAIGTAGLVVKAVWPYEKIERFATVISGTSGTQTATVVYPPGWQQIGGPAGSNFSVAEAVFAWDPTGGAYTNATASAGNLSSAAPGCTGYWAYFAAAMSVSLPATSTAGQTAACTLAAGWNLVGNPFASPARLPSGVTAYHWNGVSYDQVGTIPVGGSVWVFNDGTLNTVTLTAT